MLDAALIRAAALRSAFGRAWRSPARRGRRGRDTSPASSHGSERSFEDGVGSERDPDASFTVKNDETSFGYKAHLAVDEESGLVRQAEMTSADLHDSQRGEAMIQGDEAAYDRQWRKLQQRRSRRRPCRAGVACVLFAPGRSAGTKGLVFGASPPAPLVKAVSIARRIFSISPVRRIYFFSASALKSSAMVASLLPFAGLGHFLRQAIDQPRFAHLLLIAGPPAAPP